jgi:hypothetical protein
MKAVKQANKKAHRCDRPFCVDPAGLTPASSGTNTDMLLHTIRARIHTYIIKQKRALLQEPFFVVPDFSPQCTNYQCLTSL